MNDYKKSLEEEGECREEEKGRERRNEICPSLYRARAGVEKFIRHF